MVAATVGQKYCYTINVTSQLCHGNDVREHMPGSFANERWQYFVQEQGIGRKKCAQTTF